MLSFRSSDVQVGAKVTDGHWRGTILSAVYLGDRIEYVVELGAARVRASGSVIEPLEPRRRRAAAGPAPARDPRVAGIALNGRAGQRRT